MSKLRWLSLLMLVLALPGLASAQERTTVTGTVTEAGTGLPLRNAQVTIPALRISVPTDPTGRFVIQVPRGAHTLQVNLIGYKTVNRPLTAAGAPLTMNFSMETDPLGLDELVVVGYGEQRRRNLAGSVASLNASQPGVKEVPITSVSEIMQGRMPGVQITQNSGTPGSALTVRVRGNSSISGGNDPLYVVDGVPLTQGDFSNLTGASFGGQDIDVLSDLNPAEIEDIQVLKDASAAAIYGSRASNGVVLITTKRGIANRPEISFGFYSGNQQDWRRIDMLNADQYIEIYREGCTARYGADCVTYTDGPAAGAPVASGAASVMRAVRGVNTDWLAEVLREAPISNFEASIRGGTDKVRYYVAGSKLEQQGTIQSMGYGRMNGRLNLDYIPFEKLTLGTNISLARGMWDRARSDNTIYGAWSNAIANPPTQPVFNSNGTYYNTLYSNPVGMNNEAEAEENSLRILSNVFAQYALPWGLAARASVGLDNLSLRSRSYDSPNFVQGPWASTGGMAEAANSFINKVTYEGTVNFARLVGASHEFSGVVGTSYEDNLEEYERVRGTTFPTEFFKYITSAATVSSGSSSRTNWGLESYFGRLSWTFAERYTTTFNIRRDGSSRFGENNRFGTFPSISFLWRAGEESFLRDQNFVRNLALRTSYGITGNQQSLGNFASRGLFSGGANYDQQPGINPSQLANPELRWEKTGQFNIGTDFALLNDRLGVTFDYYTKKTDDLLVSRPVPRTTGFSSIWSNVGSMENKGFEGSLRATWLRSAQTNGLNWSTTFNISRNRNKVLELYNDQPISAGFANRVEEGKPLGFFYGYIVEGIFQSYAEIAAHARQVTNTNPRLATAPGDLMFKDIAGRDAQGKLVMTPDGVINSDDRTMIGNPWPNFEGGVTNSLSFKSIDVTAFVQFSQGNDIYNANRIYQDRYGSGGDNHTTRAMDRWTPTNTNTTEPRAVWGDPNQNTRESSRFVEDGSYVRLKNLVVGYTLPSNFAGKVGVRTARIYLQGQNLITSTDYTGFDPEVNYSGNSGTNSSLSRGTDFYTLPQARTITFGMNVGF